MNFTKKPFLALSVFLGFLSAISITSAVYQYNRASGYKSVINHSYSRNLSELTDSVSDIEFSLEKGLLINSPAQMVRLSNEINRYSNSAMSNLGQLPLTGTETDNTEKFLSQVGDFSNSLAMKLAAGGEITSEDYQSLKNLAEYSKKLSENFREMQGTFLEGKLSVERLKNQSADKNGKFLDDMVSATEEDFVNYPALVYDGPFSAHIDTIEFSALKGLPQVSSGRAKEILRDFIGNSNYIIRGKGEKEGKLPSYVFEVYSDNSRDKNYITAEVTKQGGRLSWFLNNYNPSETKLSVEEATEKAKNFLSSHGYYNMSESYYDCRGNIATINFAFEQNGIIMYPDLIKVKIAMDSGECIGFEAGGFLLNNKDRSGLTPAITAEQARNTVSDLAEIDSVRLAVIPTDFMTEILCYELKGHIEDKNYLVYVNATTGIQEKVMILLESENGILTI